MQTALLISTCLSRLWRKSSFQGLYLNKTSQHSGFIYHFDPVWKTELTKKAHLTIYGIRFLILLVAKIGIGGIRTAKIRRMEKNIWPTMQTLISNRLSLTWFSMESRLVTQVPTSSFLAEIYCRPTKLQTPLPRTRNIKYSKDRVTRVESLPFKLTVSPLGLVPKPNNAWRHNPSSFTSRRKIRQWLYSWRMGSYRVCNSGRGN